MYEFMYVTCVVLHSVFVTKYTVYKNKQGVSNKTSEIFISLTTFRPTLGRLHKWRKISGKSYDFQRFEKDSDM